MGLPSYNFTASPNFNAFEFYSTGKSTIKKRVKMEEINPEEKLYNLALCTVKEDGSEDYESVSKTGIWLPFFRL